MVEEYKLLNIVTIVFVSAICIIMFLNMPTFNNLLSIHSPLIFAFLISIVMAVCLIIAIIEEFRGIKGNLGAYLKFNDEVKTEMLWVAVYFLSLFIFVRALKFFRFNAATAVFMFIGMLLLNTDKENIRKKVYKAFGATLATVPLLYIVFHKIFKVMLP